MQFKFSFYSKRMKIIQTRKTTMMMLFLLLMLIILLSQDNVILLHLKSLQEQFAFYPSTCVLKYRLDVFPLL